VPKVALWKLRYCDDASLLVGSFVRWSVGHTRRDFSKRTRCSASVPNFTVNFSEVKFKFQGQHHRIENIPLVITRPCLRETSTMGVTIRAIRAFQIFFSKGGMLRHIHQIC